MPDFWSIYWPAFYGAGSAVLLALSGFTLYGLAADWRDRCRRSRERLEQARCERIDRMATIGQR